MTKKGLDSGSSQSSVQSGGRTGSGGEQTSTSADTVSVSSSSSNSQALTVDAFLQKAAETPLLRPDNGLPVGHARGRLMFAVDATMSRQPTWDLACAVQSDMFAEGAKATGLDVQLVYFQGAGRFSHSEWMRDAGRLADRMSRVRCRAGRTQLGRVLTHAVEEARAQRLHALVYIGDCFEEAVDPVLSVAGQIGLFGTRAFLFHEGQDRRAGDVFREIARLTNGAYVHFDANAAETLRDLLRAVAAYATRGLDGLELLSAGESEPFRLIANLLDS